MILYRPVQDSDLNQLAELSSKSGVGVTTLPKDRPTLIKRLNKACESFAASIEIPRAARDDVQSYYWFILEDTVTHMPIGVSAIETPIGVSEPFYSFKQWTETHHSPALQITRSHQLLALSQDLAHSSELCTLFVDPAYRKSGHGRFLSLARFLFIAQFPQQFESRLIADLRGVSNARGISPFWQAIGKHFFPFSFKEADRLTLSTDKHFIADLMPTHPIYLDLLPASARAVMGQPHPLTQPAMHLLCREGFKQGAYIDIFDAGPTVEASLADLTTIKESLLLSARISIQEPNGPIGMVANTSFQHFKATQAPMRIEPDQAEVYLSQNTAKLLEIESGECVRIKLE